MDKKKYSVGMIGFGNVARRGHLPGWTILEDVEVKAAADPSPQALDSARKDFNIKNVCEDYRELLKNEEIDIVDICTPNRFHAPATIEALKAGKHVLCEKPFALTRAEVKEMIKTSEKYGKKLMCAQKHRYSNNSTAIKTMIENGVFGEIYYAIAYALFRRGITASPTFITKELAGGGVLIDGGVHILDVTYWLMGCPQIHSVKGSSYTKLAKSKDIRGKWDKDKYDVEDLAAGFITFKDGRSLSINCAGLAHIDTPADFSARLFGTKAGIKWPDGKLVKEEWGIIQEIELKTDSLPPVIVNNEIIKVFFESVRDNKEVPVKPEESLAVISMLEGIYNSAETGNEINDFD